MEELPTLPNSTKVKFEVFGEDGILLYRVPFPDDIEAFDNLTMCKDNIYFTDPHGQACVYKYRVVRK